MTRTLPAEPERYDIGRGRGRPRRPSAAGPARIVLLTLILVAAVANLNLSVANVALPSIGAAFDASQVELNFVAVGYSLGLAASVLWLGALGDRYGRKLLLLLGTVLAIPAVAARRLRAVCRRADRGAGGGRPRGRHGLPHDAGPDHRLVVGAGADAVDRPVVGPGRGHRLPRPGHRRLPLAVLPVGLGLPGDPPAGGGGRAAGRQAGARPRQQVDRAGGQPRAASSRRCWWAR